MVMNAPQANLSDWKRQRVRIDFECSYFRPCVLALKPHRKPMSLLQSSARAVSSQRPDRGKFVMRPVALIVVKMETNAQWL
jgi:hypothetical protein